MPDASSAHGQSGAFRKHLGWWIVLSLLVIAWWLPLVDSVLFRYGIGRSDAAGAAVFGYMMFITMPLTALAVLVGLYKAFKWWKSKKSAVVQT